MGQITKNTDLGKFLYDIVSNIQCNIKTVVEIGTWDGAGSTECVISGFVDSGITPKKYYSLECNAAMYKIAVSYWQKKLPNWATILHGRIVDEHEMDDVDLSPDEKCWFEDDLNAIKSCENILSKLPKQIDLLILDGGEFTTQKEYEKLRDRSRIIVLDDTMCRKCKNIRKEVLDNIEKYNVLLDLPYSRNGVMVFEKRT